MRGHQQIPIALTIAGSDSGGGAGIQADLKTFAALGVHGTSAITCITAQNPRRVTAIHSCPARVIREQIEAVFAELPPAAIKTGMLYSEEIIRTVARSLKRFPRLPLVIDPVMVATSGSGLFQTAALRSLQKDLLPLASLVTPNLAEASVFLGHPISDVEDMRSAAREIYRRHRCAALVKGGHLRGAKEAVDIFYDGRDELLLSTPFVSRVRTHGTGCTLSAAITAFLACGMDLPAAVIRAKEFISQAIAQHRFAGSHPILKFMSATS